MTLSAPSLPAQDKGSNDLDTLLRDASYIFNRFEEVSLGIEAQIDANYPDQIKDKSQALLSSVRTNVEIEKIALNAQLRHPKISFADLLDVYTEMVEVAGELNGDASNNWVDQKLGMDWTQLGAKASVLGARLAVELRSQIAPQELQLVVCAQRTSRK